MLKKLGSEAWSIFPREKRAEQLSFRRATLYIILRNPLKYFRVAYIFSSQYIDTQKPKLYGHEWSLIASVHFRPGFVQGPRTGDDMVDSPDTQVLDVEMISWATPSGSLDFFSTLGGRSEPGRDICSAGGNPWWPSYLTAE